MLEYKAVRRQQLRDEAIDADEVAVQVRDAVLANRFYVITHPESIDNMRDRFDRILAARTRSSPRDGKGQDLPSTRLMRTRRECDGKCLALTVSS